MRPDPRPTAVRGWTLLELILSLAIAALALALLYSLFHSTLSTLRARQSGQFRDTEVAALLDSIRDDLAMAVVPGGDDACGLVLQSAGGRHPPGFESMAVCTKEIPTGETDPYWHRLVRVRYRLESFPDGDRLVQSRQPLVGPGALLPPVTNVVMESLQSMHVELHDGNRWCSEWPPSETHFLPAAGRISVRVRAGDRTKTIDTEFHLPMGAVIAPMNGEKN